MSRLREQAGARIWPRAAKLLDARFATRLKHDPDGPLLLASPHLDDAVLDCWSVLASDREVRVVNFFTADPPAGQASRWDRIAGAGDGAELMRARIAEDRRALALAGREPVNLPFVEGQYRVGRRPPRLAELDAEVTRHLQGAAAVLAPAVVGTAHSDHLLVRRWALALRAAGIPVTLYADLPYATVYGWPAWATGGRADPHLDVDAYWAPSFGGGSPVRDPRAARVERLDEAAAAAKLAAMRTYSTQFPTLDRGPIGQLSNPAIHRYEVYWEVDRA